MSTTQEDDVKAIRDALAEFNRRFTSANSADVGPRVSVPTAEWRELHARLLAHIDAQAHEIATAKERAAFLVATTRDTQEACSVLQDAFAKQAVRLEAAERDAKFWDYLRRHWWNCRFSWNKADASLKSLTLTIRADHISTSASEIEREVLAAIASEANP